MDDSLSFGIECTVDWANTLLGIQILQTLTSIATIMPTVSTLQISAPNVDLGAS